MSYLKCVNLKDEKLVNILAQLKLKTNKNNYQLFLNSVLGLSPETIDEQILQERKNIDKCFDNNFGM